MLPDDPPLSTPWPAPRAPLPPLRLAKLANAFGVPIPALHPPSHRPPPPDSPASPSAPTPPVSRYLLHVIPPLFLPHSSDDPRFAPLPASGYHTQYRRGILVPVYPNFQSQLAVIAKEYALPSTAGIILYLVSSNASPSDDEPGPRLSEDIWKHIWTRVVGAEQQSQFPQLYRLGTATKPLSSPSTLTHSSGTSSSSDLPLNTTTSSSVTDPDTPNTSSPSVDETDTKADAYILPGLNSSSLIPVLAKVEFDIDRKKAQWYDPWLKSRRLNQAKRTQVADDEQNRLPLALLTGTKGATIPHVDESELNVLPDAVPSEHSAVSSSPSSPHLAYLNEPSTPNNVGVSDEKPCAHHVRTRSRPEDSEKRVAAFFDDLDITDFDYDRRRSQLLMKAKLDEIEKAMVQLSPRALNDTFEGNATAGSLTPGKSNHLPPPFTRIVDAHSANAPRTDNDVFDSQTQAWPAVPYATLKESMNPVQAEGPPLPPQLAVNGITTASPMPFMPSARSSSLDVSSETKRRKKQLEEEYLPGLVIDLGENGGFSDSSFPLSPDPFRRYPSFQMPPLPPSLTKVGQNGAANGSAHGSNPRTFDSRLSMDSMDESLSKPNNRMSMRGIKKLWKRSDRPSQSNIQLPPGGRPFREEPNCPPVPDIASSFRTSSTPGSTRSSVERLSVASTNMPSRRPSPPLRHPSPVSSQPGPETRKSILKWRPKSRGESISQQHTVGAYEPRPSVDLSRPSSRASNGRRPSTNGLHAPMLSADIPPSPLIPEHFLNDFRQMGKPIDEASERAAQSSSKSPSPPAFSARSSPDSQPSFDASQFEIVFPKQLV